MKKIIFLTLFSVLCSFSFAQADWIYDYQTGGHLNYQPKRNDLSEINFQRHIGSSVNFETITSPYETGGRKVTPDNVLYYDYDTRTYRSRFHHPGGLFQMHNYSNGKTFDIFRAE